MFAMHTLDSLTQMTCSLPRSFQWATVDCILMAINKRSLWWFYYYCYYQYDCTSVQIIKRLLFIQVELEFDVRSLKANLNNFSTFIWLSGFYFRYTLQIIIIILIIISHNNEYHNIQSNFYVAYFFPIVFIQFIFFGDLEMVRCSVFSIFAYNNNNNYYVLL